MIKIRNIVFLAVIGVIAFGAYFAYGHLNNKHSEHNILHQAAEKVTGKGNECQDNLKMLQAAADKYKSDNGKYPSKIQELVSKYVKEIPKCPGGNGYSIDENGKVFEDSNTNKLKNFT